VTKAASVIITGSTAAEERARADAALQESEARYRALFAAIDEGYALYEVIFDEAGEPIDALIHEANPAYEQLTQRHDPVGKRLSEVSQGLDPVWGAAMAEVVRTGQPARFDGLNAEINRLFDVFIGPMDEPGNPHIVMILYDVTERRQATEALRASEAQLAAELADATRLQEVSSQLLLAGDSNALYGKILDAAIALMRADAGSMQVLDPARNELVLLAERGLAPASAAFWQRVEAGSTSSCAAALATSERVIVTDVETSPIIAGTEGLSAYRWSDLRAAQSTPLLARDGRVVGMLSTQWHTTHQPTDREVRLFDVLARQAADLLERVQAEDALRASEARYRLIVDRATDYAIFTTNQERRIDTWPPGAAAVYGWMAEEAVGQLMDITYAPADRAAGVPEQEFAQARDTGHAPNVRWHVRKDGTYVFIEGDADARRTEQGAFQGVFKIGQDITARLAAEEAQREEEAARREEEATLREELEVQVRVATAELRQLSRRLLAVQEEERRKLALELHDEVGQMLTGLNFQLAGALGAQGVSALMEAQTTVQALTEQVRQLSLDLRPAVLDRYGLLAAMEWHIGRFQAKTGITVHLRHQGLDERFPPEIEIAAFRVVQEALTNVARHSGADFATVQVYGDGSLTLVIRDGGRGFDPANAGTSTGLGGMRERVELLGGRLEIEAIPGDGTAIIAELPAAFAGETAS
jgi:PAS domain S-box-containing protein